MMGDILIHVRIQQEHDDQLHHVLQHLKEARRTLNSNKWKSAPRTATFLGHVVDQSETQTSGSLPRGLQNSLAMW